MVGDDAEVRDECREGVVGYFGFGGGDDGEECGFAGVRESDESDVGEDFEFEDGGELDAVFARLREAWCLECRGAEVPVAEASPSAFGEDFLFAVLGDFEELLACVGVADDGTEGHDDDLVFAVASECSFASALFAVFGEDVSGEFEVYECPVLCAASYDDVSASSAVAAVGSSFLDVFDVAEVG